MNNNGLIAIRDTTVARDDVILVEPFDPARSSGIPDPQRFAGRVVLRDGSSMLTEKKPAEFAAENGFRYLGKPDHIATNPDITFRVQAFNLVVARKKNPEFKPERDFSSRLIWGRGGPNESKLLQNDRATVEAVVLLGQQDRKDHPNPGKAPAPQAKPK
ncbi:MAG: hypothetical protein WCD20_08325 [Rhodomicrobium sp.]